MTKHSRFTDVLIGAGYLAMVVVLIVAAFLAYNRAFVSSVDVKLQAGSVGNALQDGSDVKLHGVPVGEVKNVQPSKSGATLTLALDPKVSDEIATNVTARLLPKTLFGERYVSLITPDAVAGRGLSAGDVIYQDTSNEAIELEDVFDELLPMLQSIQPDKLAAMLGEMSTMLRGKGTEIGDAMDVWDKYLDELNPHVPQMTKDFERLADVATTYDEALPDLLSALEAMTTTSKTMVDREGDLRSVYANVVTSADTSRGWVAGNQQTIEVLSSSSRKALEAVRPYARQFPCLLRSTRKFIPQMDKVLGKGTGEPGIHVVLNVVKARGKYVPGRDKPSYSWGGKPRCPRDFPAPKAPAENAIANATMGLGVVNSPAENQLIDELVTSTLEDPPDEALEFGSLLLGPVLRGAQVVLK